MVLFRNLNLIDGTSEAVQEGKAILGEVFKRRMASTTYLVIIIY